MKKLLSIILVICSLLGGNAYAETYEIKAKKIEVCADYEFEEDDDTDGDIKNKNLSQKAKIGDYAVIMAKCEEALKKYPITFNETYIK
tara:strand:- start:684 stop:947 length:264 start_codon:yes stop_codon:yes gene_type:complete